MKTHDLEIFLLTFGKNPLIIRYNSFDGKKYALFGMLQRACGGCEQVHGKIGTYLPELLHGKALAQ